MIAQPLSEGPRLGWRYAAREAAAAHEHSERVAVPWDVVRIDHGEDRRICAAARHEARVEQRRQLVDRLSVVNKPRFGQPDADVSE